MKNLLTFFFLILNFQILYGQIGRISLSEKPISTQSEYEILYDSIKINQSEIPTQEFNFLLDFFKDTLLTIPDEANEKTLGVLHPTALGILKDSSAKWNEISDWENYGSFLTPLSFTTTSFNLGDPQPNFYKTWSDKLEISAEKEEEKLKKEYKLKIEIIIDSLSKARNPSEFEKLNYELERLEGEQKLKLKFIKKKTVKAKEFEFKGRIQKQLRFFPVRNSTDAQLFYQNEIRDNKAQFLKNSLLSFSTEGNKVSIFNEIYADYFGPFRVGFGALVSNSGKNEVKDSTGAVIAIDSTSAQQDATQRLLGGGGNGIISLGYPLINFYDKDKSFFFKTDFYPKFSMDVPELGTTSEEFAWNMDIGIEGSAFYTGVLNNLTFYGNFRIGYTFGNDAFYANLLKEEEEAFFFNQMTIGIAINSTFRLGWNFYWGDDFVDDKFNSSISFSIIPSN